MFSKILKWVIVQLGGHYVNQILLNGSDARAPIFKFGGEEGADRRTLLSFQERLTPRAWGILLTSEALTLCVLFRAEVK
jgi:hypothetical protein